MKKISNNRKLLDGMKGHNYGLPDCIKFILECKGWSEKPDFWDIAALTGDTIAQVYNKNLTSSCEYCISGYLAGPEHIQYVFQSLGYSHEYVTAEKFNADPDEYIKKIVAMIDRDISVLVKTNLNAIPEWHSDVGTYCLIIGYDKSGKTVKLLFEGNEPVDYHITDKNKMDLIFIGEKQSEVTEEELYIKSVCKMSHWLTLPELDGKFFGVSAYREWADDIEAGRFGDNDIPLWENYGVYVANLATNGGLPVYIFKKLSEMNPLYSHLNEIGKKIWTLLPSESLYEGRSRLWIELEELNGGMDMNKVKITMRDREKRSKVSAALRDYASRLEQAVQILRENLG